jgi:hypothetical protein
VSIFTVLDVSPEVRRFPSQYGEMVSYRLNLRNGDGTEHLNIEMVRKADSPPPKANDTFEGDLENRGTKYGWKLNLAQRAPGGSWSGAKGGSKDFKADPVKQAAIAMETAQKSAIAIISLAAEKAEGYSLPETVGGVTEQVKMVAKMLYGQIAEVSEAAK